MKFSLFSDFHHLPGYFMRGTYEDMDFIFRRALAENASFIIHTGDLTHGPSDDPDFLHFCNHAPLPFYHVLGNHDSDHTLFEETMQLYGLTTGHYFFDCEGYRFIACDPNYYLLNGEYYHHRTGDFRNPDAERYFMPPEQLKWLEQTIADAPHPCILLSHESFEREADGVKNLMAVRKIINDANRRKPHSVILCINGHHHRDNIRIIDNVCYMEINSTSYEWIDNAYTGFPHELYEKYKGIGHTLMYNDPIHAIITLEGTTITVDGMESSMFMGISSEHVTDPEFDLMGRPVTPRVQSTKITLA